MLAADGTGWSMAMSLMILPLAVVVWRLAYGPVPREETQAPDRTRLAAEMGEWFPREGWSEPRR